jgi:hypothetical protein
MGKEMGEEIGEEMDEDMGEGIVEEMNEEIGGHESSARCKLLEVGYGHVLRISTRRRWRGRRRMDRERDKTNAWLAESGLEPKRPRARRKFKETG